MIFSQKQFGFFKQFALIMLFLIVNQAQAMVVFVNYAVFKSSGENSFVELYLKIPVNTITFQKNEHGGFQSSVFIDLKFSYKDSVFFYNRYNLISPELKDTMNLNFALTDLKRVELPQGHYNMFIEIRDEYAEDNFSNFSTLVKAVFPSAAIGFSDVQFADTVYPSQRQTVFTRNNFDIIPNVFNTFSAEQGKMYFYVEFYEVSAFISSEHLFVMYYPRKDSVDIRQLAKTIRMPVDRINYVLGNIDIADLAEGEYELVIDIYTPQNVKLHTKTAYFRKQQLSGLLSDIHTPDSKELFAALVKSYSREELTEYIDYLQVIANQRELTKLQLLENEEDKNELSYFFYNFWLSRDEKPLHAWLHYLQRIRECNRMFNTPLRKGYLTDRGRVFMEYGPPNHVVESNSGMLTYPYQIWQYYRLTATQMNKKFVFFNRTGALDEYELVHSDANGEANNPKWMDIIAKYNKLDPREFESFGDFLQKDYRE